jgi:integrase
VLEIGAYLLEPLALLERTPEPDDFILYPEKRTSGGRLLVAYPKRRMSGPTVHRWWYRHAEAAGLVGAGMTSGLNMHRARHTFATELRRVADLGAASQALGHSDLSTTASIYGHYDLSDLERAMEALARSRREEEEPTD